MKEIPKKEVEDVPGGIVPLPPPIGPTCPPFPEGPYDPVPILQTPDFPQCPTCTASDSL